MEPFGDRRGDLQAARICQVVANSQRVKGPPAKLTDFLFDWEPKVPRTEADMKMAAKMICLAWAAAKR